MGITGLKYYLTKTPGICGRIKQRVEDFIVEEIMPDGKTCGVMCFLGTEKKPLQKEWPAEQAARGSEQLVLTMEKFNISTDNAVRQLSRSLKVSQKRIGYAGVKDKRAITAQRLSIWNPDLERVRLFESRYIDLRNAAWSNERVEIGMLKGNHFTITVRAIELAADEARSAISTCFKEMQKNGIANYFGEQRFGGIREITHKVGKVFIKGNLEDAVMLYLTAATPAEEADVRHARANLAKSRDFSQAINEFPNKYRYERSIIHHLCKYPKDFAGAFRKIPKSMRYMFTHAYQSYLFNEVINARIEAGIGLNAAEGDILEGGIPTAPLFGFESVLAQGLPRELEMKVLEREGTTLADFKIKHMPEMSSKGLRRKIILRPENPRLIKVEEDELNSGRIKAVVAFDLPKGTYATTVLRELMKCSGSA